MRGDGLRQAGRWVVLLLAGTLLAGCNLIDQNTFAPAPEPKPAVAAAPAPVQPAVPAEPRRALVIIDYATPAPDYRQLLHYAVRAALARDRAVRFDVVALVSNLSTIEAAQHDAVGVMRAIMADGVPASRIHLGLRVEPGLATRQVRVYVR